MDTDVIKMQYENLGAYTYLVYRVDETDLLDEASLSKVINQKIPGIVSAVFTQEEGRKVMKYNISAKIPVSQIFLSMVRKDTFIQVLSAVTNILISLKNDMLDTNYVWLDLNQIYMTFSNHETEFIYLPIKNHQASLGNLYSFLQNMIEHTQFDPSEDGGYINVLVDYLNQHTQITPEELNTLLDQMKNYMAGELQGKSEEHQDFSKEQGMPPAQEPFMEQGMPPAQEPFMEQGMPSVREPFENQGAPYEQELFVNQEAPYGQDMFMNQGAPYEQEPFMNQGAPYEQEPFMNQGAPYEQEPFMNQGASYGQEPFMNQGALYGQEPFENQGIPYGQEPFMNQGAPYGQEPFMNQGAPYGQEPFMNQGVPYGQEPFFDQGMPSVQESFENQEISYGQGSYMEQGVPYGQGPFVNPDAADIPPIPNMLDYDLSGQAAEGKEMSMFYLLKHYNKENKQLYKEQKALKKQKKEQQKELEQQEKNAAKEAKRKGKKSKKQKDGSAVPEQEFEAFASGLPNTPGPASSQPVDLSLDLNQEIFSQNQKEDMLDPLSADQKDAMFVPEEEDETEYTALWTEDLQMEDVRHPVLMRKRNSEKISVNKPVFTLGRETKQDDYYVTDNTFVSRSHAILKEREGKYFILDNHSKNHVTVNGQRIEPGQEVELHDGDTFKLASEEFEFLLQ